MCKIITEYIFSGLINKIILLLESKPIFISVLLFICIGGTTMFPGLTKRLKQELDMLVLNNQSTKIQVTSPENRKYSVWQGGSVLASLPTFTNSWITYEEYAEDGANIIHRKCF